MNAELFQFKEVHWGDLSVFYSDSGLLKVHLSAGTFKVMEGVLPLVLTWKIKVFDHDKEVFVATFDAKYKLTFPPASSHFNDLMVLLQNSHVILQRIWEGKVLSKPLPILAVENHFDLINEILDIARKSKLIQV